jgi:hypothetical protein
MKYNRKSVSCLAAKYAVDKRSSELQAKTELVDSLGSQVAADRHRISTHLQHTLNKLYTIWLKLFTLNNLIVLSFDCFYTLKVPFKGIDSIKNESNKPTIFNSL